MPVITALIAGLVFGLGLLLSGMADPHKVLAFLDVAGAWDPSLMLVMAGAIAVAMPAFFIAKRMDRSLTGQPMSLPKPGRIDRRLLAGSAVFGVGWGLAGICPGPAVVATGMGPSAFWVFLAAMVAGMALFTLLEPKR